MDSIVKELDIPSKNIFPTNLPHVFTVIVNSSWLKKWLKNKEVDNTVNNVDFALQPGESVPYPWRKIFIRVINKRVSKVLPLPRYKLNEGNAEPPLTFSQLLQYVSQNNQRNLWKDSYRKYCQNNETSKDSAIVNLMEHDQLVSECILRLYGCNIIRIKCDGTGKLVEYKEIIPNKYVSKCYETHSNLLAAMFTLETDTNYFIVYQGHYENTLLDCLNFSPNLIDKNYSRGLFLIYQLLNVSKAMSDRGLSLGTLTLQHIYMSENLWIQILPPIYNNVHPLDASLIYEQTRSKQGTPAVAAQSVPPRRPDEWCGRAEAVELEKLCMLWVRGRISNLDYLLHLNMLAGRSSSDPQAHFIVPWVTDFSSRCGRNWRDLTKSKYRLTKGDRQLDLTYDVAGCPDQIPHHVSDALSDITCYVYLARRTPKEILCKHVRNKWVPAEYPASIQRMQQWTPDECVPEFYTDPLVFKSIHEDLPDLGIPSWASCVEDFITKHREALESAHVSETLHHWIDLNFGYKLSGIPSIKAKNVCLSLVDGHSCVSRGATVQLLTGMHPARAARPQLPAPPRLHWTASSEYKKSIKPIDSSDEVSDEEEESTSLPQHISRLSVPSHRLRSRRKSASRARSLSKSQGQEELTSSSEHRASSHTRHYRVQRSELGKGIIYLPKEFNPVASIQALETLDHFRSKCFFNSAVNAEKEKESLSALNLYPMQQAANKTSPKDEGDKDDNSFTNHIFLASYEQNYLKKFSQDAHLENVLKERKNRSFNTRYTTDAAVYKQFVTESRRQDMLVIGCLIVEIFLHTYMRPLRTNSENFIDRYNTCRTVLKYNFNSLPKCVSYVASLLLNVQPPSLSSKSELSVQNSQDEPFKKIVVTDKGLPPPTPSQLLQPLLMQHLIPFPATYGILYNLLSTLHEYELTSNELNILYMYECDGVQCEKYQNVDKTKLYFSQRIAEGKIQACVTHLDALLNNITSFHQFDVLDIFLSHYVELLRNKDTSVLAAWYLFDTVSKALGPLQSKKKLLKHILSLYEDDEIFEDRSEHTNTDYKSSNVYNGTTNKQKFIKLYHNLFLLQLMVRFGLQCFLENFTQHLVEAVGGYKDINMDVSSPGHVCRNQLTACKKPRYSDDNLKSALSTNANDLFSPDTSFGSEQATPNAEKLSSPHTKERDGDNRSENELFHFETDKDRLPSRNSRSKSPAESLDSYTLNVNQSEPTNNTPSPSFSPHSTKEFIPEGVVKDISVTVNDTGAAEKGPMSPTINIPKKTSMFTSYLHFADEDSKSSADDVEVRQESLPRDVKLDFGRSRLKPSVSRSFDDANSKETPTDPYKISEVSSESLLWLANRLGPVLTCRYITRNLLKMLTLCYIGKVNLVPCEDDGEMDEFDAISIANSRVVGDRNAKRVIKCLTSIVAMYGEELILFQYLPHTRELIASCRARLSAPLEGGVVACLQLLKYLLPHMQDARLMEQLQDTFLKSILHPSLRLLSSLDGRSAHGPRARAALARKLIDATYALATRIGPEMTRRHLCVPALQRFFLIFDKACGKTENWPKQDTENSAESKPTPEDDPKLEGFLEICRDGSTAEWSVRDGRVVRRDASPDLAVSPPERPDALGATAQEELLAVFNEELAHQSYTSFCKLVGADAMDRSLKNLDTVQALCQKYERSHATSPPMNIKLQASFSDEPISRTIDIARPVDTAHISSSNSFGSNVTLVGNRIDVAGDTAEGLGCVPSRAFRVVAHQTTGGVRSNRHLRGDWLIYWEHEIGRPDKDNRFNLKQMKLQTFVGHTACVKSLHCLDNETSFMSGSKDKTVRLWSLANQGDGNAVTQCNWTYTGHKKGVLSLSFLESLRLAVSTDSVVHIWDPFMESVVSQLDNIKAPVSIVRALPGPSTVVIAATTDCTLKVIDARACNYTHDLKLPCGPGLLIRCVCVSPSGRWAACGLSSGHVVALHTATARALATWRAHDAEVLRLATVDDHRILSSGLDQTTALWRVDDGELIAHLKGTSEPVHCLSVHHSELITGTTNNRIGVHTGLHHDASFSSTKLRSESLKGVLSSMAVLPLNRLLLLASDSGNISLIC
ncbi:WD repeat-containing protein 81 [Plutella xylostella]|uniref:WD repeat-containing protein 81 n=1 Tax=Plutella xylostella TaxID=51655 RepID=UPI002032CC8B|nr:WD repeat-containing protein 81 [Plutella xylostella]